MSQSADNNPFVLPGLGQAGSDLAGNPLFAGLEMMRRAWTSLAGANGLAQSLPMSPMLNIEELDKRLAELKSVESWLSLNLSMLSSTIQGLEVQRATLTTLRSFMDAASHAPGETNGGRSPLEIVLGIQPGGGLPASSAAVQSTDASRPFAASSAVGSGALDTASAAAPMDNPSLAHAPAGRKSLDAAAGSASGSRPSAEAAETAGEQVMQASRAWWDMMQQQFQQLAAATAARGAIGQTAGAAGKRAAPAENGPRSTEKPLTSQPDKPVSRTAARQAASAGKTTRARKTASPAEKASALKSSGAPKPHARKR